MRADRHPPAVLLGANAGRDGGLCRWRRAPGLSRAAGFDTAVAFRDDEPSVMEVRRFAPAWKTWEARPGEYYMATNGQKGSSWRAQNRSPHKLVGTGLIADGFGTSEFYRRMPDSYHRTVSWIAKGRRGDHRRSRSGLRRSRRAVA